MVIGPGEEQSGHSAHVEECAFALFARKCRPWPSPTFKKFSGVGLILLSV